MKTAVLINPAAANGRVARHVAELSDELRGILGEYDLLRTERPNHATELVREALRNGCQRIISVGGDGTHNEAANGFFAGKQAINPSASLAILSYGTGADFGRTLHLPRGLHGLERLAHAQPMPIDVGVVTHGLREGGEAVRYFINVADFGVGGAVVDRVNRTTKFFGGFLSFLYGVVSTLATYTNKHIELDIDGNSIKGRMSNVIIANGQYYGGGMHVAPEARLDSGEFEVYVIGDIGRKDAMLNLPKIYRGHLLKRMDKVQYFLAKRIMARSDETVLLNLDGEQPGCLPATFEILPRALNILV